MVADEWPTRWGRIEQRKAKLVGRDDSGGIETPVVDAAIDNNVRLASRNVQGIEVTTADNLNTYQVLRPNKLLVTRSALEKLEARLKD